MTFFLAPGQKQVDQLLLGATAVADPGEGPGGPGGRGPPLFLDQTEAQRAEKKNIWDQDPLSQGLDDPPPLSEGLDLPLDCDTQVKWKTRLGKI